MARPGRNWCDGFLPGMMWIFHKRNRQRPARSMAARRADPFWMEQAIRYTTPLEPRKHDREVHDLGFIFLPTYYRWYRLTRDPKLQRRDHRSRQDRGPCGFRRTANICDPSWARIRIFIDIMMNVGIIFYAARETGDRRLRDIALRHCLTTRRFLVRGDGSTAHEGIFDLETGEFLRQATQQGYRGDSCWSRGLAWSLYGFSISLRVQPRSSLSRNRRGLRGLLHHAFQSATASRLGISTRRPRAASCWIRPRPRSPRPACCAFAGLLQDPMKGHYYWSTAIHDPSHAVRKTSGEERQEVGRDTQGRRVSPAQRAGRG